MTKVTVVTLYDDSLSEHYVAVVNGAIDMQERKALAKQFKADLPEVFGSDYEDQRVLFFREVQTCETLEDVTQMLNIDG